jgi:hypothetical protein
MAMTFLPILNRRSPQSEHYNIIPLKNSRISDLPCRRPGEAAFFQEKGVGGDSPLEPKDIPVIVDYINANWDAASSVQL